ncbi:exodeoxyribonuclease V subunit beta [soil metagenome]
MRLALPHDPSAELVAGRTIIEASAGTGKTHTVSSTVTSLVAAEGVGLEQILVVTFTRAATAELRERVRSRMVDTRRALGGAGEVDDHMRHLVAVDTPTGEVHHRRLTAALRRFDRAQIFTIHGFAQRLLASLGFASRLSPDLEPGSVDDLLVEHAAADLVVARFAHGHGNEEVLARRTLADIARAVLATPDATIVPDAGSVEGSVRNRVELAHEVVAEVRRRLRAAGAVTFDDGLAEVAAALADPGIGPAARQLLARRYAVALVDESQDTDPTQWGVLRAVFDRSRLVVIGDPKQSIYSFRGADVESYLSAVEGAADHRTLTVNYRSDAPLIDALDALFEGATFGHDLIAYHSVRAGPERQEAGLVPSGPALTVRRFADALPGPTTVRKQYTLEAIRPLVAADAAAEVVRLLSAGLSHRDGTSLSPGDLAVLCRTRLQVDLVRNELSARGVPSVAARTGGVFTSAAAEEWRRFLVGVERPDHMGLVRLAASTLLVGYTMSELSSLEDVAALDLQQRFKGWLEVLRAEGVPALLANLNAETHMAARVLSLADGERTITDLNHIAEEMHAVWRRARVTSLAGWLDETMAEAARRETRRAEESEARQRRLETDADAVQVQTIHGAKGLQYPVVLVPYAWDAPGNNPSYPVFHDPDAPPGATARPRLINVAGNGSPGFERHCDLARQEDAAEEGRSLYVALTRARCRLVLWWVPNTSNADRSKLHELLTDDGRSLHDLIEKGGGEIAMPLVTELASIEPYQPPSFTMPVLARARFDRPVDHDWRRASFSSLSPEHPLAGTPETSEEPLREDELVGDEPLVEESATPAPAAGLAMAALPRGAHFGTLVHEIIELIPFDSPDLAHSIEALLAPHLATGDWDFDAVAFTEGMVAAMRTPLGPGPDAVRLVDLRPANTLHELSFEFPVRTSEGVVSLADIAGVMLDHLDPTDPYRRYADTLAGMGAQRFRGYLTGSIDLTAAVPADEGTRYVVMDYKSNAMPALGPIAGPLDYGPSPLVDAMIRGNYVLQATLYQVALHRYLQWRLPGYDPGKHLGGSAYLFLRGMAGPNAPVVDGERCGVARWQPPAAMVIELSQMFAKAPQ